jgi:multisubunit Na+/H+ antiporter MnhB subunit
MRKAVIPGIVLFVLAFGHEPYRFRVSMFETTVVLR